MSRPAYFTCPARSDAAPLAPNEFVTSHYTLIYDNKPGMQWDQVRWKYRDRSRIVVRNVKNAWYTGSRLTWEEAQRELEQQPGPHPTGAYNEARAERLRGDGRRHTAPIVLPRPPKTRAGRCLS